MEVEEIELLVIAFPAHPLEHDHMQRIGITHRAVEAQRLRPRRLQSARGLRGAAGEQCDVVPERDEFLGQPVHHPLGAAIKLGWNSLRQRSNLRDAHLTTSFYRHEWAAPARQAPTVEEGTF